MTDRHLVGTVAQPGEKQVQLVAGWLGLGLGSPDAQTQEAA